MKIRKILMILASSVFILFGLLFLILDSFIRVDLDELSGNGELQDTFLSPDKEYQADLYIINKGGTTVGHQERVSISSLGDNKKEFNDKTIYWLYPSEDEISIEWKGNDSIVINGTTINITDEDTYYNWKEDDSL